MLLLLFAESAPARTYRAGRSASGSIARSTSGSPINRTISSTISRTSAGRR